MWWLILASMIILLAFLVGIWQSRAVKKTVYQHTDAAVPAAFDGFRVVQVSDYHNSPYARHGKALASAIADAKPDLIVLTGDLFNRRTPEAYAHAFAFVQDMVNIAPVYFVDGNHEWRCFWQYPSWKKRLIALGVNVLEDAAVDFYRGGSSIRLIGMRQIFDTTVLRDLCRSDVFQLILSHRPEVHLQYTLDVPALVLTGHAHGGQARIFGAGVYAPEQGVFPRYVSGAYRLGRTTMYVSRGIGNTVRVPRVFDSPEWNLIILLSGEAPRRKNVC